jgi:anti-anti-sigma regulatory factor
MADGLRIDWNVIGETTFVSLVGNVDSTSAEVVTELGKAALDVDRLVVDLEYVESIDESGVLLLDQLTHVRNIGVVNLSDAVVDTLAELGRHGLE